LKFTTQITTTDKRRQTYIPPPQPLHPAVQPMWKCIRLPTGQLSAFRILPTVPQEFSAHSIPHFTFRIPHAAIPHSKCLYTGLGLCALYIGWLYTGLDGTYYSSI